MRYCLLALLFAASLFAEEHPRYIWGVYLVPSTDAIPQKEMREEGIHAKMKVPSQEKLYDALSPFIGRPMETETLLDLKRETLRYYRDQGYPIVQVKIPAQKVGDGVVAIVVEVGKLGEVRIQGNEWFSNEDFTGYIRQKEGEPIKASRIFNDVAWINRNPFRRADLVFSPGQQEGTADVDILVKDKLPMRVYAGGDNTGNPATGNARFFAGINSGNMFGQDHLFTYQYSTDVEFRKFQAHTLHYTALLPWRHAFAAYGGVSYVKPKLTDFKSKGKASQASFRYQIPFAPLFQSKINEIAFGLDIKSTNNNLLFEGETSLDIVGKTVNLTQLCLSYSFAIETGSHFLSLFADGFFSPGRWIHNQENSHFAELHPKAVNHYLYGRIGAGYTYTLPKGFALYGQFRAQMSTQNLIPSEQFGLGGYDTVRGYGERTFNYDDAVCLNFEARSPSISLISRLKKKIPDSLVILAFFDFATGKNAHHSFGEDNGQILMGAGPGLRYTIGNHFSLRYDLGFKLHRTEFTEHLNTKSHLGAMLNY